MVLNCVTQLLEWALGSMRRSHRILNQFSFNRKKSQVRSHSDLDFKARTHHCHPMLPPALNVSSSSGMRIIIQAAVGIPIPLRKTLECASIK